MFSGGGLKRSNSVSSGTGGSGGLFGSSNTTSTAGDLFGNKKTTTGSTFGQPSGLLGAQPATAASSTGGGLFGSSNSTSLANNSSSGGLFGGQTANQNQPAAPNLFGSNNQTAPSSGLFGAQNQAQNQTGSGLFGAQPAAASTTAGSGLFGNLSWSSQSQPQSQPQPSQPLGGGGLFSGANTAGSFAKPGTSSGLGISSFGAPPNQTSNLNSSLNSISNFSYSLNSSGLDLNRAATANPNLGPLVQPKTNAHKQSRSFSYKSSVMGRLASGSRGQSHPYLRGRISQEKRLQSLPSVINDTHIPKVIASNRQILESSRASQLRKLVIYQRPNKEELVQKLTGQGANESQINDSKLSIADNSIFGDDTFLGHRSIRRGLLGTPAMPKVAMDAPNLSITDLGANISQNNRVNYSAKALAAAESGYWMKPSFEELSKLTKKQLRYVSNFEIGRKGVGKISFNESVDLSSLYGHLDEICDGLVVFVPSKVCVYPDDKRKAERGSELNVPATITLENITPTPGQPLNEAKAEKFAKKLQRALESRDGGRFLSYDGQTAEWKFVVDHFSYWGIDDMSMDSSDEELADAVTAPLANHLQKPLAARQEPKDVSMADIESSDSEVETTGIPTNVLDELDDVNIANGRFATQDQQVFLSKQTSPSQLPLGSEPDLNLNSGAPLSPSSFAPSPSLSPALEPVNALVPTHNQAPRMSTWSDQLREAAGWDSIMSESAAKTKLKEFGKLKVGDLASMMYDGGSDMLLNTDIAKYIEASEKMRLPSLKEPWELGKFTSFSDKIIVKDPTSCSGVKLSEMPLEDLPLIDADLELSISEIGERSENALIPLIRANKNGNFAKLESFYGDTYKLASILFDSSNFLTEANRSKEANRCMEERWRRTRLIEFFEVFVTENSVSFQDSFEQSIVEHDVQKAADHLLSQNEPHLATVATLLSSNDLRIRKASRDQVKVASAKLSKFAVQLYELAGGDCMKFERQEWPWYIKFALRLFYGTTIHNSVSDVVRLFVQQCGDVNDFNFKLLAYYADLISLRDVLTEGGNDYTLLWHISNTLSNSLGRNSQDDYAVLDYFSVQFGYELEACGLWYESLFVLLHCRNGTAAINGIQRVVANNIDKVKGSERLLVGLKISPSLLDEYFGDYDFYRQNYWDACRYYIQANREERAHQVLVKYIAPEAVIENTLKDLSLLLGEFKHAEAIKTWSVGGGVYRDYIKFATSNPSDWQKFDKKFWDSFAKALEKVQVVNDKIRIALNVMSQELGNAVSTSRLQEITLGKNGYLKHSIDYSARYLEKELLQ